MELPFHLKTIEPLPGALDILRLFGELEEPFASSDTIIDELDLSDRRFSKAIRRLVTKGYLQMDGDQTYRLTEQGQSAVEELQEYDDATGGGLPERAESSDEAPDEEAVEDEPGVAESPVDDAVVAEAEPQFTKRRMVLAVPQTLAAGKPVNAVIGFYDSAEMSGTAEMVVRVSVLNGEPQTPEDAIFSLSSGSAQQAVQIVPGAYTQVRVKIEAYQLGDNPGEIESVGGMYVDLPVVSGDAPTTDLTAYGTDIQVAV
jgi:predicted transcriptional regulator